MTAATEIRRDLPKLTPEQLEDTFRVDLLPPDVYAEEKARRQRILMMIGGALFLALIAGFHVWQLNKVSNTRSMLTSAEVQRTQAQSKINKMEDTIALEAEQERIDGLVAEVLGNEKSAALVFNEIFEVLDPAAFQLDTVSYTAATTAEPEPVDAVETHPVPYGQVSVSGTVRGDVLDAVRQVEATRPRPLFFNEVLSSVTSESEESAVEAAAGQSITFTASVSQNVFTGRYVDGLTDSLLEQLLSAPNPFALTDETEPAYVVVDPETGETVIVRGEAGIGELRTPTPPAAPAEPAEEGDSTQEPDIPQESDSSEEETTDGGTTPDNTTDGSDAATSDGTSDTTADDTTSDSTTDGGSTTTSDGTSDTTTADGSTDDTEETAS